MLNYVWIGMIVCAFIFGAFTGKLDQVSQASTDSAKAAVELVVGLIGVMAFWLGMMRVLQKAGLLKTMAKMLKPITSRLFPDIPADHPAMGMMIMNISANMLGLGNAATPFGLKAMVELNKLNKTKGVATNSMVLFLAINTSNIALLPTGMIALRASLDSVKPGAIIITTLIATTISTIVAIIITKSLQRIPLFSLDKLKTGPQEEQTEQTESEPDISQAEAIADEQAEPASKPVYIISIVAMVACIVAFGYAMHHAMLNAPEGTNGINSAINLALTRWPLAILIVGFVLFGMLRGVNVYNAAVEGGREAFQITLRFVPFFIIILVGIGMLRSSGAIEHLTTLLQPILMYTGLPAEALPMALLRPLSGSGAFGVAAEIMQSQGPDSLVGYIVSTMQGSTETTFYVIALYFGVIGIKNSRHTILACLTADLAGIFASVWACRLLLM